MSKPDFIIHVGGDVPANLSMNNANMANENINEPNTGKLISETILHKKSPLQPSLLNRLERQKLKYWHFRFKNDADLERLKKEICTIDPSITVEHNYGGKKHPDLILFKNGTIYGKVHFLYVNRPDICDPKLFYVKIHYYDFVEDSVFNHVKSVMTRLFNEMETQMQGGNPSRKRHPRKRNRTRRVRKN